MYVVEHRLHCACALQWLCTRVPECSVGNLSATDGEQERPDLHRRQLDQGRVESSLRHAVGATVALVPPGRVPVQPHHLWGAGREKKI